MSSVTHSKAERGERFGAVADSPGIEMRLLSEFGRDLLQGGALFRVVVALISNVWAGDTTSKRRPGRT